MDMDMHMCKWTQFKGQGPGLVNVLWARASKHRERFVVKATQYSRAPSYSEIARDFRLRSRNGTHTQGAQNRMAHSSITRTQLI